MTFRLLLIALAVLALTALVVYSQFWPEPNRVSGFIEADEIRAGSRVGGRVKKVHVQEGDPVEVGQVLVELEPFDLEQRESEAAQTLAAREAEYEKMVAGFRTEEIAQAKARYDQLEANLDLLKAGPRKQEKDAAAAQVTAAEKELELAEKEFNRRMELADNSRVSQEELDIARKRFETAQTQLIVEQKQLEVLQLGSREEEIRAGEARLEEAMEAWELMVEGYRDEEIEQARAARDAAKAALAVIREQIKELKITSPVNGAIEALDLQPGDLVAPSAPVLSIMDDERMWVRAFVPQNRVGLQPGDKLRVTVDSFPDQDFEGEIIFISRDAEFTPNNVQTPEERAKQVYRVKVLLKNGHDKVRPGMTASVWLDPLGESP